LKFLNFIASTLKGYFFRRIVKGGRFKEYNAHYKLCLIKDANAPWRKQAKDARGRHGRKSDANSRTRSVGQATDVSKKP